MKKIIIILIVLAVCGLSVYFWHQNRKSNHNERMTKIEDYSKYSVATFAGGCFWCSESDFEKTDGVVEVVSGYTGGEVENPSYKDVSSGKTGHREAIQVFYDPQKVTYEQLLDVFWRHIDPTDGGGQFADRGEQYSPAIFFHDEKQKELASKSKEGLEKSDRFEKPIETPILKFDKFFVAEDYHQDYHEKNSTPYKFYRERSGRDDFIEENWGDTLHGAQKHRTCSIQEDKNVCGEKYEELSDKELQDKLTELQYDVTQNVATEKPFDNLYWDNHEEGIYVDVVSGEPLFSSTDKFDSGTGWPSFLRPIEEDAVTEHDDFKLIAKRTEIRSKVADSHLGHIILDGPEDNDKIRYCMNSAALRFVPKEDLEKEGYGKYLRLFE